MLADFWISRSRVISPDVGVSVGLMDRSTSASDFGPSLMAQLDVTIRLFI
jgi:hypothetical protein